MARHLTRKLTWRKTDTEIRLSRQLMMEASSCKKGDDEDNCFDDSFRSEDGKGETRKKFRREGKRMVEGRRSKPNYFFLALIASSALVRKVKGALKRLPR